MQQAIALQLIGQHWQLKTNSWQAFSSFLWVGFSLQFCIVCIAFNWLHRIVLFLNVDVKMSFAHYRIKFYLSIIWLLNDSKKLVSIWDTLNMRIFTLKNSRVNTPFVFRSIFLVDFWKIWNAWCRPIKIECVTCRDQPCISFKKGFKWANWKKQLYIFPMDTRCFFLGGSSDLTS